MALWAAVIIGREIAVSALREWMAELGERATVKVAAIGKIKTIVQMVALICLLYQEPSVGPADLPDRRVAAGRRRPADAVVGLAYLRAAWPILKKDSLNS